jgi:hypothetical protein
VVCLLLAVLGAGQAHAQVKGFRWVDHDGNVHYAARRDQCRSAIARSSARRGPGTPPRHA